LRFELVDVRAETQCVLCITVIQEEIANKLVKASFHFHMNNADSRVPDIKNIWLFMSIRDMRPEDD
jgi:predicted xylose isomerase-like sugar epimerase